MLATVHIPESYERDTEIKALAGYCKLTVEQLHNSKSIKVKGKRSYVMKFVKKVQLEHKGVTLVYSKKHIRTSNAKFKPKGILNCLSTPVTDGNKNFSSQQIAQIYGITNEPKRPINIAVIELGGGFRQSDLETYWAYLGLTVRPNVIPISVDGVTNSPGSSADEEVVLDIEVIGGIIGNNPCNIYVYFAPNSSQGYYNAIHAAVYDTTHNPSVISISWSMTEKYWDPDDLYAFNELFQIAASKGINICVASGDNGASDGVKDGKKYVNFPASSPYVLACGGTNLVCPSLEYKDKDTKEIVWGAKGNGAAGGGISSVFDVPSYQSKLNLSKRGVPDVCGVADPKTGWIIYLNGKYQIMGGTSAVAPMWAAYLGLLEVRTFINPILYENPEAFNDIIHGNNEGYSASKGWDKASGLGSPNGQVLNGILLNA